LEIKEKHAPGSLAVANGLTNLGNVASDQGDLEVAGDYHRRALEIKEKHAPGSLNVAASLTNLGNVALGQGDLPAAMNYLRRALEIQEEHAPGSLDVAASLTSLGSVALGQGDLQAALVYHRRALEIQEKRAPGSLEVARSFNCLGLVASDQGDLETAEERLAHAWKIVREQRLAVVGDEAGRAFGAFHAGYASDLVGVRLARGKTIAAFGTLEESRAQGLLQLLSERGLARAGVDANLWRHYEAAEDAFATVASQLSEASAKGEVSEREEALSAYTQARLEKERLLGEVRRQVPGLEPRKFSFDEARRALPGDAVFVAFSLGADESAVFVIPSDPERAAKAHKTPLGEAELSGRIAALRAQIGTGSILRAVGGLVEAEPTKETDAELVAASRALFDELFPPEARAAIEAAERVIVSPDGPLWELPFAALVTTASGEPAWLGLEKRLSYTPSLTVLAQERERPPASGAITRNALVVGDPVFVRAAKPTAAAETTGAPSTPTATPAVLRGERSYLTSGGTVPARLPATAAEARRIAELYGTKPLLGESATEAAVRDKLPQASIVHLATHGYFHPHLAMSSGVLLAPPAGEIAKGKTDDDGALQAWEFGMSLPLRAELVVLSACETGRGELARGEGLVGLTRSLQAAGARTVVATHWKVADEATAELMVMFHKKLKKGVAKDEALRQAMKEIAGRKRTAHPFYWAPFFLTGDPDRPLSEPGRNELDQ